MSDGFGPDVLLLAQRLPFPPDRGDRITTWNLCRHFLGLGARLRIGSFLWGPEDLEGLRRLHALGCEVLAPGLSPRGRKISCLKEFLRGRPLTLGYFGDRRLLRSLRDSLRDRRPDLCLAYSSSMGAYLLGLASELEGVPKVMHFAELDSDKWAQYARNSGPAGRFVYGREARLMLRFERRLAAAMDLNLVVSPVEAKLFRKRIPDIPVSVLPNGVDLEHFRPGPPEEKVPGRLIFTGVMDYLPNVDGVLFFVRECWPALRERVPDASFTIVGRNPTPEVRRLGDLPGVVVTGGVPETPPWFQKACAAVVPLRLARGIQNKVLEAMASGLPVVCTTKAHEGIRAEPGAELLVADEPSRIVETLTGLLERPAWAEEVGKRARACVERNYDWDRILEGLDRKLGLLPSGARAGPPPQVSNGGISPPS